MVVGLNETRVHTLCAYVYTARKHGSWIFGPCDLFQDFLCARMFILPAKRGSWLYMKYILLVRVSWLVIFYLLRSSSVGWVAYAIELSLGIGYNAHTPHYGFRSYLRLG